MGKIILNNGIVYDGKYMVVGAELTLFIFGSFTLVDIFPEMSVPANTSTILFRKNDAETSFTRYTKLIYIKQESDEIVSVTLRLN